jgi:hypothetical protein
MARHRGVCSATHVIRVPGRERRTSAAPRASFSLGPGGIAMNSSLGAARSKNAHVAAQPYATLGFFLAQVPWSSRIDLMELDAECRRVGLRGDRIDALSSHRTDDIGI